MKEPKIKPSETPETSVFPVVVRKRRLKFDAAGSSAKPAKRDKIFSQSRDNREDRGERQAKTTHNPQTMPHGH